MFIIPRLIIYHVKYVCVMLCLPKHLEGVLVCNISGVRLKSLNGNV